MFVILAGAGELVVLGSAPDVSGRVVEPPGFADLASAGAASLRTVRRAPSLRYHGM